MKILKVLFLILLVAVTTVSCFSKNSPQKVPQEESLDAPKVLVETQIMEEKKIQPKFKLPGVVEPLVQGRLTSEIQGTVTEVRKRLGDKVKKNEVVLYIKNNQVGRSFKRYAVRAPVAGQITALPVTKGAFIEANQDLGTVTDSDSLRIVGEVPADRLPDLKNGQKSRFQIGNHLVEAEISGIGRQVKANTGTARVELTPKEVRWLVAGTVGQLTIFLDPIEALAIPLSAKFEIGESVYVRKIINNRVELQTVLLGNMVGQSRLVLEGLEEGEEIVVEASDYLKSGDPIKRMTDAERKGSSSL